jgi:hypothetical protein
MSKLINIFNFKTGTFSVASNVPQASEMTGVSRRAIQAQLNNPELRVHELRELMVSGLMSEVTRKITLKTQTYEFSYSQEFVVKAYLCSMNPDMTYSITPEVSIFRKITECVDFLGCSRQTLYNRKSNAASNMTPIKSFKNGEYYMLEFADQPLDKSLFGKDSVDTEGLYLVSITTDKGKVNKEGNNLIELYRYLKVNSPYPLTMPYVEFYASAKLLSPLPENYLEMYNEDNFSFTNVVTNRPYECTFGVAITYDYIGVDSGKVFSKGAVLIRIV